MEMDPYPEYFQRVLCNYTRELVTRTFEEMVGRCIFWDVKMHMLHVYAYGR